MSRKPLLVSTENAAFQHLETLKRNRAKRTHHGEAFVEGVMSINRALDNGWDVRQIAYDRERSLSDWARGVIRRCPDAVHLALTSSLMAQLSEKEEASELVMVFSVAQHRLGELSLGADDLVVLFDRPTSHGNLGSVIRSCDALGVRALLLDGHGVDVYDPRTIRGSMGSLFVVPVYQLSGHSELEAWLRRERDGRAGLAVVGTSAHADVPLYQVDLTSPSLILVGNETYGLSRYYTELADVLARIPMVGTATSLNVASATTVILYEAARQRSGAPRRAPDGGPE